jgi:hypothetical protein
MSDISVTVTNAGSSNVTATSSSTYTASVGNGGAVIVSLGTVSPGNATVVSGTLQIGKVTTLSPSASATAVNVGTAYAAVIDLGLPQGQAGQAGQAGKNGITPAFSVGSVTTGDPGTSAAVKATTTNGGANVALAFTIPRGAAGSGGGSSVSLSDATPSSLGTASAGTSSLASRADHVHATPTISYANLINVPSTFAPSTHTHTASQISDFTTAAAATAPVQTVAGRTGDVVIGVTDIAGLTDSLANVNVEVIDGGDYVGVVVTPTPSITITAQPAAQSVSVSSANEASSTLPSGTWGAVSRVNGTFFVSGASSSQSDYVASSTNGVDWTKRYGMPNAGNWSAMQYQNGIYATQYKDTVAYSTDLTTWSSSTISNSAGSVFAAGGKFLRMSINYLYASTDCSTWTQVASLTWPSSSRTFGYSGGKWFLQDATNGNLVSSDATTWSASPSSTPRNYIENIVTFGGSQYIGQRTGAPIVHTSGTWSTFSAFGSASNMSGCSFATNGTVLVAYNYMDGRIYTSTNGATWVPRPLPVTLPNQNLARLIYANGQFALVMSYQLSGNTFTFSPGTIYFTSSNGIDWTQQTRAGLTYSQYQFSDDGYCVTQNNGAFSYLQIGASAAVASFAVSAFFSGNAITYQWQLSTNAGSTWADVSGATTPTFSLSGLTTADNGKRYRCVLSATGAASVTTNSATLTVT